MLLRMLPLPDLRGASIDGGGNGSRDNVGCGSLWYKMMPDYIYRLFFHKRKKPRGWVRRILFARGKTPRKIFNRVVFKKNGKVRPHFAAWMIKEMDYFKTMT